MSPYTEPSAVTVPSLDIGQYVTNMSFKGGSWNRMEFDIRASKDGGMKCRPQEKLGRAP